MKSLRTVLFSLLALPMFACGGDGDVPAPTVTPSGSGSVLAPEQPIAMPDVATKPDGVDGKIDVKADVPVVIPTTYSEALALGKDLATKGDVSRAKEVLEAAAKLDRKKAEPHIELARLYIAAGERALAIKSANKAVKLAPASSQAYNTLGRAELLRHAYDNAIVAFRQATELNGDNAFAWNNLGYTYLTLKNYQDAIDALTVATELPGATGYMFNNLGTAYEHLDQLDDARLAFDKGAELGSSEAKASRKRLEGVDTIIVMKSEPTESMDKTYDISEPMPEEPEVTDDGSEEPAVEETTVEPKVEEPTPEEPETDVPADAAVTPTVL